MDFNFDINKRKMFTTVEELLALLNKADSSAPVEVCDHNGWLIVAKDLSEAWFDFDDYDDRGGDVFQFYYVYELGYVLRNLPVTMPISVCDFSGWFHASKDYSYIGLFADELDEYYGECQGSSPSKEAEDERKH